MGKWTRAQLRARLLHWHVADHNRLRKVSAATVAEVACTGTTAVWRAVWRRLTGGRWRDCVARPPELSIRLAR